MPKYRTPSTRRAGNEYRILSLDGGGSWALLQVRALQEIYGPNALGHDVLKDFDLVAANSGGSITAVGLFANYSLKKLLDLFLTESIRRAIFSALNNPVYSLLEMLAHVGPKYSTAKKLKGLQLAFAKGQPYQGKDFIDLTLQEAAKSVPNHDVKLMITSFDYDLQRAVYFRSFSSSASSSPNIFDIKAVEAVHASSTPPILYFNAPALVGTSRYWDGGLAGLNNPVLAAVIEAVLVAPRESICILSLGTGTVRLPVMKDGLPDFTVAPTKSGFLNDVTLAVGAVLDDPPDAASFEAYVILGLPLPAPGAATAISTGKFVRLNPRIGPIRNGSAWASPPYFSGSKGLARFKLLSTLRLDAVEQEDVLAINSLADAWLSGVNVPNQGIRMDANFAVQVGHDNAAAGIAAWR